MRLAVSHFLEMPLGKQVKIIEQQIRKPKHRPESTD